VEATDEHYRANSSRHPGQLLLLFAGALRSDADDHELRAGSKL
jgi:hypothetical protein